MNKTISTLISSSVLAAGIGLATPAFALPTLQLDIWGGSYDAADESIFINSSGGVEKLGAYCTPGQSNNCLSLEHFISVAILDENGNGVTSGTDFGSFSFNNITYTTSDLIYGNPPEETTGGDQLHDSGDLAPHGVFPTLFKEIGFYFSSSNTRSSVNTQDDPGTAVVNGSGSMYYSLFDFDISGLKDGWTLHFDLYNEKYGKSKGTTNTSDLDVDDFAPFSHDAYATKTPDNHQDVPEPGTIIGLAFLGGGLVLSRRKKA